MSFGSLMQFVRLSFPARFERTNGSILSNLCRRYPEAEVEAMVKGAKMIGAESLRLIWAENGEGRRNALTAYYRSQQQQPARKQLESLASTLKQMGLV